MPMAGNTRRAHHCTEGELSLKKTSRVFMSEAKLVCDGSRQYTETAPLEAATLGRTSSLQSPLRRGAGGRQQGWPSGSHSSCEQDCSEH